MEKLAKTQEDVSDADVSAAAQFAGEARITGIKFKKHSASTAPVFAVSSSVAGSSRPGEQYATSAVIATVAILWEKLGLRESLGTVPDRISDPAVSSHTTTGENWPRNAPSWPREVHRACMMASRWFQKHLYTCTCRELRTGTCTYSRRVFR